MATLALAYHGSTLPDVSAVDGPVPMRHPCPIHSLLFPPTYATRPRLARSSTPRPSRREEEEARTETHGVEKGRDSLLNFWDELDTNLEKIFSFGENYISNVPNQTPG